MGKPAPLYVITLLSFLSTGEISEARAPANFLPFGVGDTLNPILDDGTSQAISLQQPFKYFGSTYNQIFVNNNGLLTFTEPLYSYNPILKSDRDIIAPLWTDLDNRRGGTISYREDTSSAVLAQVTAAVKEYFPDVTFAATSAFVATWDSVPYYNGGRVVTFQVVLAYNFHRSFVLIKYGDIAATTQSWLAGYHTMDAVNSFTIPVTSTPQLSSTSNINVTGHWSFRVDGSLKLPTTFLDFDEAKLVKPTADNESSEAIILQHPFKYFGRTYNQIFVNNNGYLTFTKPLSDYNPSLDSARDVIAPLWTRLNNRHGGTVSYKEDTSSAVLAKVTAAVKQYFPNIPFAAKTVFVATWDSVPYRNGGGVVSFQVVLAYNVHRSFILIYYGDNAETGQPWQAGYNTLDSVSSFTIPAASVPELSSSSNINVTACWSFHVDGSPILPANFLPFGNGETVTPRLENGSSEAITLQQPFKFFGRTHNQTFVNNDGHLTFTEPLSDYIPLLNSGRDIIAPLWTHLDNRRGGTISCREDTSSAILEQVTAAVKQYFPNVTFAASSAFVATWDSVPYYNGGGVATFQVVLVSSVHRSFILLNYGDIAETEQIWQAGYSTVDSVNSFTIPVTSAPQLSSSSNINVNGRCSFHVDGAPNLPTNFLPTGDEETVNPPADDGSSDVIFLQQPFKYFGRTYNQIFVNNNGYLTFTEPLSAYNPSLDSARDIIAPLWTRLENRHGGTVSYREDTSSAVLAQVTAAVKQYFPNIPFAATTAFVATWDSVPYHSGGGVVSFQVVLAYNVHRSFILIYYGDIAETGQPWQAGYNTMDSVGSFTIPAASVPELSSSSNINVTACWSFHVDGSPILPANFLPFGNGEIVTPRLEIGSSEAITLQQPFKFFGRTHNQTFVNNHGHLTFTEPLSDYIPLLNSGRDIIAPLWTHLDNRRGGTISCREDTSSAVLAQVTAAVEQYFPNVTFAATSAFVATWDSVPYYNGTGVATFQVVLVSSVHRSFILLNYGDIAETEQIWQAGYSTVDSVNSFTMPVTSAPQLSSSSNINVNGRCSFHVDGAPNLPTNFLPTGDEETVNPPADDGSSDVIFLQQPFKYFGCTYNQIFVNNNGYLTFTEPMSAYNPSLDSARDIIAPLWTRLDNRRGGTVSYREDTSSAVLAQVTAAVKQYFPNIPFAATTAFVATWDSVPYHSGGGVVSFQVVLAYNVHRSFILIYYGDIAETGQPWQAGYKTVDSVGSFTIPAASVPELSSSSNINVTACWSFHVDGSPILPANFLPFGNGEIVTPRLEIGSSEAITLQQPFKFFGRTHNQTFVNNHGHLTFTEPLSDYIPLLNSGRDIIAPLWTHLDNRRGGTISCREDTSSAVLAQVTAAVEQYFPNVTFAATSAFVATWDSVPYYNGTGVATFQVVLVSSVHRSFILLNYGDIAETEQIWQAGYSTVDSVNSFTMPVTSAPQLSSSSNINVNGRCSFHVDGAPNLPTNFLPTGDEETVNPPADDGSSDVIFLQQPFKYFGCTYNQIFVNNNGYLTFTEPMSAYNPSLDSARDIIAPLWTRLDNRRGGTVSYREDTSSAVLAQVTAAVKQYFPNIPFAATTAFVATWDSVPYHSGGGVVSFQVVLAYNVHRSFILIYYGDIAETGQPWQAGYKTVDSVGSFTIPAASVPELSSSSNINVTACWSFHVDGSPILPANFLPFGNGEIVMPRLENGSSEAITLQQPFKFFGRTHNQTFVNNHGHLTFTEPLSDYIPLLNSGRDIIAPLWTRLDNRRGGTISCREDTSSAVLAQVTAAVEQYFPNLTFAATSAFVATWDSVPYYNGTGVATFQVVLVSSVHRSFILLNYGDIAETEQIWQAGYSTVDSVNSFTMSVTSAPQLSSSSNINVNGRCSFHVDGSPNLPTNFLPTGDEETVNPPADDGSSDVILLQQPFKYFGRTYNQIFVNNNGYLTFTEPMSAYNPSLDSARDIIAPLWTHLDNRRGGTVSYREDTSSAVLAQVTAAVKQYFPNIPFAATTAFVATWDSVPYHSGGGVVSFQVVLAYNVHRSFILIYYGDIAETGQPWQAGYKTVDSVGSFTIPAASVPELSSSSNINVTACWSFHVDGSPILPANFLPFGNGEIVMPRLENGSSEAITLQQPFKFFGRTHNQTFVNNHGHLTFTEPLSDYIPLLNSGRDIIAPLWTRLDNRRGGTISCREDTSSAVLAQVTAAVEQYFPNLTFAATSAFVATWDSVPYYNGTGVATFQVVLVSSVHRSFILLNYGDIAETEQIWQAGYSTVDSVNSFTMSVTSAPQLSSSSNINVNGRCSFHVDGSPNLPTNFLPTGDEETVNPPADDGSSDVILLQQPFKYFGRTYNQIFVNNNGYLTFTEPMSAYNPSLDSARDIIAPLWTHLDNRRGGTVSYREDTSSAVLSQVTAAVKQYFPNIPFAATTAFVATWDSVPYHSGGGVVSFQVVLAFNVHRSFILIYYGDIAVTGQPWQAGYNTMDSVGSFTIPAASVPELSSSSNINVTACWSFHVDGSPILPANFLPFGNGEIVTPRLENGSSEAITLQQPFKFFGRTHNQTFVNNHGHLTFTEPLSNYIPLLNSGRDIIAPLWTRLDNRRGGTISCREDRSSAVLAQVTAAVEQYFPNVTFAATSAFVATWDSVPYHNGTGVATFQVVLVSSVHRSFILLNYGDIAETEQIWQAGYSTVDSVNSVTMPVTSAPQLSSSSNINVNGRCSFHVDGAPNLPTNFLPTGDEEIVNPPAEDGSSDVIFLQQPFKYFGRTYNQIFVNNNGYLTFTEPLSAYNPSLDSTRDIIAPLWTHLDNRHGGTVSYREDTSSAVLAQVTAAVKQYFPNIPFAATTAFVATWDSVPYHNGGGAVSFQVVLAYNVHRSFILIYYGDIAETGQPWQAGYNTVDSVGSFTIPAASVPELSSSSNINVTACWSFHVDGSQILPANFLPFGNGEIVTPRLENGSSEAITLQQPFKFFGRTHNQTFVNNDGHLTFTEPLSDYIPLLNSGRDIIAPLWTDLDNGLGGTISCREDTSSAVLAQVNAAVKQYFPNVTFAASSAFVATWDSVPYFNGEGVATFQVVLVSSVHRSFILLNYGDIAETEQIWQAGYSTVDSVNSFTMPVASAPQLSSSSNINVNGRCSFHVDGAPNLPTNFLPTGDEEIVNAPAEDGSSDVIFLQQPFKYFGRTYNQIFVNNNGYLTFTEPLSAYNPSLDSARDIIAPLWTRLDNRHGGTVSYREDTSSAVLAQVTAAVKQYFPNIPFAATTAFVATWDSVPYHNGGGVVSFQVVLAYNVHRSFILIYYGDIAETGQPWQAGYNTVDSVGSFTIPAASVPELSSSSNINVTACWSFHVDGSPILPANFLPFGNGEIVTPRLENGSSEAFTLQQPFKFFGCTHNQTFVNNHGHLTFTEPLSDYIPLLNSGRDIIAPLWTRLDNRRGGTISCREDRSSAVLAQVTAAVEQYFPNVTFAATSAFVATWDSVPYHNGTGVATFQVVLVSSVHRSFILLNYGDIAETEQIWQAGYSTVDSVNSFTMPVTSAPQLSSSSNINVNGRCSFHVDGAPNLPTNFLPTGDEEIVNPPSEDGSSDVIFLQQPFKYFGRTYNQIFVNNNGYLTFTEPLSAYNPSLDSARDIIAPLWTRLDNRHGGTVSYREDTSSAVLAQVTAAVKQYFTNIPFAATTAFVATWDSVPYHNGGGVVSFQVVLAYNVHRSFILIYYGDIAETGQPWQAGYNTVDSVSSFTIPAASVPELSSSSNINVTACWSFHVDGSPILPANFLPFGNGEIVTPRLENGSSEAFTLQQPFKFFGRAHNQTFVNNHGHLTFTEPLSDYIPLLNSGRDIIAPLWTRLDNRRGGTISCREDRSSAILAQVTAAVEQYFPNVTFAATSAFVATWDSVPYHSGTGVATFQVVLVSSVHRSFILLNYGDIAETEQIWQAGYSTVDSVNSFTMSVASAPQLSSSSNINVNGRCSFHVDGAPNLPTNFLPTGDEEIVNPPAEDGSSDVIFLQQPFKYFGRTYNQIFVNNNGYLTFTEPLSAYNPSLDSARDIIAPLWTRLDNRHGGTVSCREDTSSAVLAQVTAAVKQYFPNIPFAATTAFVATWDSVPYHNGGGVVSFQVVLAYNVHRSFILIYYGDIAETGQPWQAGYNTVDSVGSFTIPAASVPELSSSSNINVTACWSFHVDGSPILPANFLPFGNGEIVTPRLENGSSEAFTLLQPFKFFGRTHNQTFVNNHGHLTFTEPLSDYIPLLNSGRDIIAPLWTRLDNRRGGTISCREDSRSAVLAQVTAAVKQYFPNVTFAATSAFVATWDSVPYYNDTGVATFQVVLVSSVHRSFILLNYGDIAETEQIWQAGYSTVDSVNSFTMPVTSAPQLSSSSNINVNGRCSFHVDGAPNLPTNFLPTGDEETINPPADDGSSDVIFLQQPFKYFGRTYNQIFVNNNGYLTFTEPLSAYNPSLDSARDIIAPLWTRLDNRHGGTVSYREDTSSAVLAQVTAAVKQYFPNIPFAATTAFVATWDSVPYHSGGGVVSFQVVLAYNVHRSFILIYYGDIAETGQPWQAGYNTVDSVGSFTIPAASVPELSSSSNINVTACWSFHVDVSPILPANFLPFGNGEIVTRRLENGSSEAITLQQPFKFFGRTHNQTFVNNHGHIMFTEPLSDYIPLLNSGRDIIAPLWTRLDNRRGGTISCREDTSSAVLAQVTAAVEQYFPNVTFAATSAFVATWDSVPYYNGTGVATFQVVLVSSVHRSFILLNYGDIAETEQIWQAGYSTVDSVNSFTLPVTSAPQLSSSSNVNVNGRCSFHVDGAPNLPTNFLPTGDEEIVHPPAEDGSSDVIFLQHPFKYFGRTYNQIFVNNNGYLTFTEPLSAYNPFLDSARDIIAPLWTRLDNRHGGTVSYREDTSSAVLAQVTAAVKQYFPNIPFAATTAFVATWDSVPYHNGGGVVSFQVVLAYNVHRSFILIYYGDIAETGQPWQAGYNTVDSVGSFTIPAASVPELSSSSNINVTACWSFNVDGSPILPANFLPFGNGEIVTPRLENGSSEAITLQQPFKFFGRTHNQTFVNNHGHLTFTEPLSDYIPLLNSGRDIIAPLWTDLDNGLGGTISCREDTSSAVLAQVTAAVKQYFPNVTFAASSAFVATWDSVPYFNGEGVATFQVVLVSSVHRSFILLNYGDIAETEQIWQAGYGTVDSVNSFTMPVASAPQLSSSSNINVNGRCSFHVDGAPNLPTNFLPTGDEEIVNAPAEDGSSDVIFLQQPFKYFGRTYNQIFVNNNGYLTFTEPLSAYNPSLDSARDIIAPLSTRLDNRYGGTVSYREDTSSAVLAQVTAAVKQYFPNIPFAATTAFVATWDSVPYHNGGGVVSFQVVLAYNIHRSFILIYYGDIAETGQPWQAGYNTVDSVGSFTIPAASVPELSSSSNINVTACWSFHVDGSPILPANFLPFGNGEIVTPRLENGSSEAITLQQPFKFFGRTHNQTFVNNDGHLTFTEPLSDYIPLLNSERDIIAPLWTDLDNRHGGTVSYREDTSSAVLAQVTAAVKQYFPNIPFAATSAFVATWDSVPYYNGRGVATFQVVLVSSVHRSFILLNYGDIAETAQIWQAGYSTVDSVNSFTMPVTSAPQLSSSSNINVNGRCSFHVDGAPNLPTIFLPTGDEEIVNPPAEDGSSDVMFLQQPFKYFGRTYNQIFVNNNGYLTFTEPLSAYNPSLDSARDIIAPLWTRLDNRHGGTVSYREDTSSAVLAQVTVAVKQYFPNIPFAATTAFVATWDSVPYHNGGGVASFQVVLAYNVHRSFILIYYGDIAETGQPWQGGYNTVDSVSSFTIPAASVPELSSSSNINVTACWSFHVDGSPILPANFLPFGNGEIVMPRLENGSSEAITLQQPFKFFGRTHNQTFVNNHGHLTFTEPLSDYIPLLNSGRDIIAPLWTHLDNGLGGTISCREDTSSAVLAQVTAAVEQYFPNVTFAITSAFVATWDSVPYFSGGGVATFQVVLVSSVHHSFILLNYGDIAETEQIWQAGYSTVDSVNSFTMPVTSAPQLSSSSNINVNGRCSFHVDGAPNLPTNFLPTGDEEIVNPPAEDGSSDVIFLQQPFKYFGRTYNQIFVNNNGYLTFTEPLSTYNPSLDSARDIIAPLWTRLDNRHGGTVSYREDTSSAVLAQVTAAVKQYFPNIPFAATSAFVATWDSVPYYNGTGVATFQVVLVSSVHRSFILLNYGDIAETEQIWQAGYSTVDSVNSSTMPVTSAPQLSSSSNVNVNGRWVFHVYDDCDTLGCHGNEVCRFRDGYGCGCLEGERPNPESFDAMEFCASSTGTISLSRCQLFESGFPPEFLHLNDPNCKGISENGRVLFHFDNEGHVCGTTLSSNGTHFIYQNTIQSTLPTAVITRQRWINISFSCAYPLIQTLSMPKEIQAEHSVLSIDLPGWGTYQIRMIPYHDAQFTSPYEGDVEVQVNQQMYVAVEVEGVDRSQIATVLDNCWATPVNDIDYQIRWNLIIRECPNPEDGTVEVLQNGIDTRSHFSFRMFTFTSASDQIFLHCQMHLCLVQNGRCAQSCNPGHRRRRRRSLDFYHSAAITMGLKRS